MLCLELKINGRKIATAGLPGTGVITSMVTWHQRRGRAPTEIRVRLGGLDTSVAPGENVHWAHARLGAGDKVSLRVVEGAAVDPPRRETYARWRENRPRVIKMELKDIEVRRRQLERELKALKKAQPPSGARKSVRSPRRKD